MDSIRAHLAIASVAAAAIQLLVLASIFGLGVSEAFFETLPFRVGCVAAIACAVVLVKRSARAAFESAEHGGFVSYTDSTLRRVSISHCCQRRDLVVLHARMTGLNRDLFDR